ncbi:MAG TPA: hypothetical protein GXX72_01150 [Clostridiaceae bacterium]|nr:hypothetical protein [Clostridiaceae bacterium]
MDSLKTYGHIADKTFHLTPASENKINTAKYRQTFSDCSELKEYLTCLTEEQSSVQKLSSWLQQNEQGKNLHLIEDNARTHTKLYDKTLSHLKQRQELLTRVVYHLARLHAAYRETLVSLYLEHNNLKETALLIGKSVSTVKRYRNAGIVDLFLRLKQQELSRYQTN